MMITSLVSMYEKGAITADHLVVECLGLIDPEEPGLVLGELPESMLERLLDFARMYQAHPMVSNYGRLPGVDQVRAAENWVEAVQKTSRLRQAT